MTTGITDGYNSNGPCSSVASNAAFTINNANTSMNTNTNDYRQTLSVTT